MTLHAFLADYVDELTRVRAYDPSRRGQVDFSSMSRYRDSCSYAIPTAEAIHALVSSGPVVEIGAGTGFWAALVAFAGGDIVAYDMRLTGNEYTASAGSWHPVEHGSADSVSDHPDRTLFLCWPPYDSPMAYDSLVSYRGDTVIYVGELSGGCTGTAEFFGVLDTEFERVRSIWLPNYTLTNDAMYVWRRK